MTDTDRVWANPHDDVPTNDEGVPIHPEEGHPICGYEKTDAVDKNGRKREDVPFCLLAAGWGTDRSTGHCSKHGGAGGAPEGWKNGNARHLLYSKRMNEDDVEEFEALVETADGERIGVEEMAEMLESMVGFEYMRLARAVDKTPGVEQVTMYRCPKCGDKYRQKRPPNGECDGSIRVEPKVIEPCNYRGDLKPIPGKSWVEFGDEAVERKESRVANLIATYKKVSEGTDVNVKGDHDVTVGGDGEAIDVNITGVGVDLPADDGDADDADNADDADDDSDNGGEDE